MYNTLYHLRPALQVAQLPFSATVWNSRINQPVVIVMSTSVTQSTRPNIAIILPVYNAVPYLRECLDTIVAQTYKHFTVFAIDDGSTDESGSILDEYAARDSRFRVTHQKNGGISFARNTALDQIREAACFDYVGFIDNDDIIMADYLEKFVRVINEYHPELAFCCYQRFTKSGYIKTDMPLPKAHNPYTQEDVKNRFFHKNGWAHPYMLRIEVWGSLFSFESIRDIRFDTSFKRGGEDLMFSRLILPKIRTAAYIDEILYFWRQRKSSASHMPDEAPDFEEAIQRTHNMEDEAPTDTYETSKQNLLVSCVWNSLIHIVKSGNPFPRKDFNYLLDFIKNHVSSDSLDKRRKRYIKMLFWPLPILKIYFRYIRISSNKTKKFADFFD